jgi:threonylcarbamoyladenosine tRNA methylthiotransferase MtaB
MKVYLDWVGCRLNEAEIEIMARQFRAAGHEVVASAENADVAVINTCAVTSAAASDSRAKIRRLSRAGSAGIVATGCWATLEPIRATELPQVTHVVPNNRKDGLVAGLLGVPGHVFDLEPIARTPLPGLRRRTRAFIKAQDGCNNRCTFCITTVARGVSQTRAIADVVRDVQSALDGGALEIVLTGVHLGGWGRELGMRLEVLVQAILSETNIPRLRLSSIEPWDLDPNLLSLWRDARLCPHLHLPLQSGCATTLRRMARKTSPASFRALMASVREVVPDVAVTTDVIAGFPGESDGEFQESLDFVRQMDFAGGHAFTYSPRIGTVAAGRSGQVAPGTRRERTRQLRAVFDEAASAYRRTHIGETRPVLWESAIPAESGGWQLEGLTGTNVRVRAVASEPRWNKIDPVELTQATSDGLQGIICKTG